MFLTDALVFQELEHFKPKNNTTPDIAPSIVLKKCALSLARPIAILLRFSFYSGSVPNHWKKSLVLPLYKSGSNQSKSELENYRPISLTSDLAKLADKLVFTEISSYFRVIGAIPPSQHGFQSGKSVTSLLLECHDDWTLAIDNKMNIDFIMFDIRKAFDTVNIQLLVHKLESLGITGSCLSWISDFLSNRSFKVKIGNSFSQNAEINSGVPQGGVLSPLLFNIFIADLVKLWNNANVKIKQFADDLGAYVIYDHNDINLKQSALNDFIVHLVSWGNCNGMEISIRKCRVLYMGSNNPRKQYSISNEIIESVSNTARYLGLTLTPDLK